jgi:hypothetical protein
MTDENVRRLLHYSKRERVKSLRDEKLTEIRRKVTRHFAILKQDDPAVDAAIEDTLAPLGTRVLWMARLTKCSLLFTGPTSLSWSLFRDFSVR